MPQSLSAGPSRGVSPDGDISDLPIEALESLQQEFERMHVSRRQKINSSKLRRAQHLRSEYRIKIKDEHIKSVLQRRSSLESQRAHDKRMMAEKKQRRRESRLRLIETVGTNALKLGHCSTKQLKSTNQRRKDVLKRKEMLQQQKDAERKQKFLEKQRKRDRKVSKPMRHSKYLRPQSASNSFLFSEDKENDDDDSDDSENVSFLRTKKLSRSKSQSFVQCSSSSERNTRSALKALFGFKSNQNKRRKAKKSFNFMKPTLSAYLFSDNPTCLLANC